MTTATRDTARAASGAGPAAALVAQVPRQHLQDAGRTPGSALIHVALVLNYRNPDELEAFIRATSDPASPQYGHFLSPQEFAQAFAPAAADYNRVVSTLVAAGFKVGASANRSIVEASAPAAVVERFFGTQLHTVRQAGVAAPRYSNVTPAYLPAALRDVTYGVAGLNNLIVAKVQNVRGTRRTDVALGPPLQGPDTGLGPYAFASVYDFPIQHARPAGGTYDGSGHAAGIAIDADLLDSDLASFLSYFGITRTGGPVVRVPIDGGPGYPPDADETTLDSETIGGLAPGARIYLYLMPELSTVDIVDTYTKVVTDDKVDVLNSSFGGCEISGDNFAELTDHVAAQGAAEGITFSASSGDLGASICIGVTPNFLGVSAPASGPHFTGVGGTSLIITPAAAYRLEFAWVGSGGGVSTIFALPSYQKGVANVLGTTRNVPDIAFDANPGTGAAFFFDGFFEGPIGGTSLSSPIFSALVTERNEVAGKRAGLANTALYAAFKKTGYTKQFRDITVGNNAIFGAGFPAYNAGPGYDDVTGIGSILGWAYAQ